MKFKKVYGPKSQTQFTAELVDFKMTKSPVLCDYIDAMKCLLAAVEKAIGADMATVLFDPSKVMLAQELPIRGGCVLGVDSHWEVACYDCKFSGRLGSRESATAVLAAHRQMKHP